MQQLLKKHDYSSYNVNGKSVVIFVDSKIFKCCGNWLWEMNCDSVFCSDVIMPLPNSFDGTKAIIHPEDLQEVKKQIFYYEAVGDESTSDFEFRIINTYGEVRTLTGKEIKLVRNDADDVIEDPLEALAKPSPRLSQDAVDALNFKHEVDQLLQRSTNSGTWFFNLSNGETYYSDNYFYLFGLPAQSLNNQLYTFAPFLHPEDKDLIIDAIDTACRRQLPLNITYRIIKANDEVRFVQHISKISFNAKGETVVNGFLKDVTEIRLTELELEQEKTNRQLQNKVLEFSETTVGIGHWQVNLLIRKFTFSDQYYKIFGLKQGLLPSLHTLSEFVHPDDRARFSQIQKDIITQHIAPDFEFKIIRPDGKIRNISLRGKLVINGKSDMMMIGTVKDVTLQTATDKKLSELKKELYVKDLAFVRAEQMAGMATWFIDTATDKTIWSENIFAILGIKGNSDSFTFKALLRFIHPDDRQIFSENLKIAIDLSEPLEFEFRLLTRGNSRTFKATLKPVWDAEEKFIIGVIQDVTEQYASTHNLNERKYFTEILLDSIQDKIMVIDTNFSIIEWNKACEVTFAKKKNEVFLSNFFDVFPNLKNGDIIQNFRQVFDGDNITIQNTYQTCLKGHHIVKLSPLKDSSGNVIGILQILVDNSKEVELQQSLNQRINLIEHLVEISLNPLIVLDNHLNYLYWNNGAESLFGINKEFIISKNLLEITPPTKNNPTHVEFRRALKGETVLLDATEFENGKWYNTCLTPIKNDRNMVSGILWSLNEIALTKPQEGAGQQFGSN